MHRTITVDAQNAGRRLDAFLRQLLPGVPRGTLMKWLRRGVVRVNGRKRPGDTRLSEGDELGLPAVAIPEPRRSAAPLPPPVVVYEDDDLLVVDKPAGVACHPGTGHEEDSLEARITGYLGAGNAPPGHRPGLAQRLDRGASGLVPAGKNAAALRSLNEAVRAGKAEKLYLAIVEGAPASDRGTVDLPLRIDERAPPDAPRAVPDAAGLRARTHYLVSQRYERHALLEVRIETGRTHQIRAHLAALGHPIVGDRRYGATRGPRDRPLLHAVELTLPHPKDGRPIHVTAEPPPDFAAFLTASETSALRSGARGPSTLRGPRAPIRRSPEKRRR